MTDFAGKWSDKDFADTCDAVNGLFNTMGDASLIAFSGGAPAKEALPVEVLREIAGEVLQTPGRGVEALAYGRAMGLTELREIIADELLAPKGLKTDPDRILITCGGMEALSLACEAYIDPGDVILTESPTFVQAVMNFKMFGAKCISCEMDDDGLIMEDVEDKLKKYRPKMIYTIPTFQNPSGITMSLERRKQLAELAEKYDTIILEDDPYRDIRYSGEQLPPIKSFDETGHVIMANSFSKIFSPGCRLGYAVADEKQIKVMADAKTALNSHSSMIAEVLCAEFFKRGYFPNHLNKICEMYTLRRDAMTHSIAEYFPKGTKYVFPDGGLFTWAELPEHINTSEILPRAIREAGVAYLAGESFYVDKGKGTNCMRLCFSSNSESLIRIGMERLGKVLCDA